MGAGTDDDSPGIEAEEEKSSEVKGPRRDQDQDQVEEEEVEGSTESETTVSAAAPSEWKPVRTVAACARGVIGMHASARGYKAEKAAMPGLRAGRDERVVQRLLAHVPAEQDPAFESYPAEALDAEGVLKAEEQLLYELELIKARIAVFPGHSLVNVASDGNCALRAYLVATAREQGKHADLRAAVHAEASKGAFQARCAWVPGSDVDNPRATHDAAEWLQRLGHDGTYLDERGLQALACAEKSTLHVLSFSAANPRARRMTDREDHITVLSVEPWGVARKRGHGAVLARVGQHYLAVANGYEQRPQEQPTGLQLTHSSSSSAAAAVSAVAASSASRFATANPFAALQRGEDAGEISRPTRAAPTSPAASRLRAAANPWPAATEEGAGARGQAAPVSAEAGPEPANAADAHVPAGRMPERRLRTDGTCKDNGQAALGIYDETFGRVTGKLIHAAASGGRGGATAGINTAEALAVVEALRQLEGHDGPATITTDSHVVWSVLAGKATVTAADLYAAARRAHELAGQLRGPIRFRFQRRNHNGVADKAADVAIERKASFTTLASAPVGPGITKADLAQVPHRAVPDTLFERAVAPQLPHAVRLEQRDAWGYGQPQQSAPPDAPRAPGGPPPHDEDTLDGGADPRPTEGQVLPSPPAARAGTQLADLRAEGGALLEALAAGGRAQTLTQEQGLEFGRSAARYLAGELAEGRADTPSDRERVALEILFSRDREHPAPPQPQSRRRREQRPTQAERTDALFANSDLVAAAAVRRRMQDEADGVPADPSTCRHEWRGPVNACRDEVDLHQGPQAARAARARADEGPALSPAEQQAELDDRARGRLIRRVNHLLARGNTGTAAGKLARGPTAGVPAVLTDQALDAASELIEGCARTKPLPAAPLALLPRRCPEAAALRALVADANTGSRGGKAPGLSHRGASHLQGLFSDPSVAALLTWLATSIVNGEASEEAQRLLAAKKVAVVVTARGDGTSKVRPIAVGETFSTIIERWLLRDLGDSVAAAVGPYQTGVGGSASSVVVGVAAALRADPASVAVTWDLANYYGSVQRADVMAAVYEHLPALGPYAAWRLGPATDYLVVGRRGADEPSALVRHLVQRDGLAQGDVLSALFAALAARNRFEQLVREAGCPVAGQYIDDAILVGRPDKILAAPEGTAARAWTDRNCGRIAKGKSALLKAGGADDRHVAALASYLAAEAQEPAERVTSTYNFIIGLGVPVLGPAAAPDARDMVISTERAKLRDNYQQLIAGLEDSRTSLRGALQIAREVIKQSTVHLAAGLPVELSRPIVQPLDEAVHDMVIARLAERPGGTLASAREELGETVDDKMDQKLCYGGLGLGGLRRACLPNRLSCLAKAASALPPPLPGGDVAVDRALRADLVGEAAHLAAVYMRSVGTDNLRPLTDADTQPLLPEPGPDQQVTVDDIGHTINKEKKNWARKGVVRRLAEPAYKELWSRTREKESQPRRAAMMAALVPGANLLWQQHSALPNATLALLLFYRLGGDPTRAILADRQPLRTGDGRPDPGCGCAQHQQHNDYHANACRHTGGQHNKTHDAVVRVLQAACTENGIPCRLEGGHVAEDGSRKRPDLAIYMNSHKSIVDVTVVSQLTHTSGLRHSNTLGSALQNAERIKDKKNEVAFGDKQVVAAMEQTVGFSAWTRGLMRAIADCHPNEAKREDNYNELAVKVAAALAAGLYRRIVAYELLVHETRRQAI